MKTFLLTIGLTFCGILPAFAQDQAPLTIDPAQSSVTISIAGASSSSQLSGNADLELLSGNAQITELNLVLDDALLFNLFGGFASASTSPGDVNISLVAPGAPGPLLGAFNQLGNSLMVGGDLAITDAFGFAGGNQTFDLSTITIAPVDFNLVSVTQLGSLVTISNSVTINETVNFGAGDVPIIIDLTYVASGIVVPSVLPGDVNLDGVVNPIDIMPFIMLLITREFQVEADFDQNGSVNFLDILPFAAALQGQ